MLCISWVFISILLSWCCVTPVLPYSSCSKMMHVSLLCPPYFTCPTMLCLSCVLITIHVHWCWVSPVCFVCYSCPTMLCLSYIFIYCILLFHDAISPLSSFLFLHISRCYLSCGFLTNLVPCWCVSLWLPCSYCVMMLCLSCAFLLFLFDWAESLLRLPYYSCSKMLWLSCIFITLLVPYCLVSPVSSFLFLVPLCCVSPVSSILFLFYAAVSIQGWIFCGAAV